MQIVFLGIIAAALVAIAFAVFSGRLVGPQGPRGERGPAGAVGPAAATQASRQVEVLKHGRKGWAHHAWVRENSDAWAHFRGLPGFAVRLGDGSIDEGVQ